VTILVFREMPVDRDDHRRPLASNRRLHNLMTKNALRFDSGAATLASPAIPPAATTRASA